LRLRGQTAQRCNNDESKNEPLHAFLPFLTHTRNRKFCKRSTDE